MNLIIALVVIIAIVFLWMHDVNREIKRYRDKIEELKDKDKPSE